MRQPMWILWVLNAVWVAGMQVRPSQDLCVMDDRFVNCSYASLAYIPLDLPPAIIFLDVSHNAVSSLQWSLPYFHLQHLNLSRNSIFNVNYHIFIHLFSLDTLDLSHNNIKYLYHLNSNVSFYYTQQLAYLNLRGNPLKSLGSDPIRSDSLIRLDVSECDIRSLEGETSLLLMPNLKYLFIDHNPLMKMDILVSESLEELHARETRLRYIKPEFYMGLSKLKYLDISKNHYLTRLSSSGIATSSSLNILKAEFCSLEFIRIRGLSKLEELYLKRNRIDKLSRGDFAMNERLTYIDLSMNRIHQIDPMAFEGATSLSKINLSGNKIYEIGHFLPSLTRLLYLNVSHNPLFSLDNIETAPLLSVLDASNCDIFAVPLEMFALQQLEIVNLSKNSIWLLPSGMSSFTLIELDLSHNRLSKVDNGWFKHFPRLKRLSLEGNRLSEPFHPEMLTRLSHVQLKLANNPWRCNCDEERYRNFYLHLPKNDSDNLVCHRPDNVSGLSWKSACFAENLDASVKSPQKKNAWLPMLLAALTTIGIVFLLYLIRRHTISRGEIGDEVARPRETPEVISSNTSPRQEASLPSYEEALLMPKPHVKTKSNADTQTQASFLGSIRSLDSRSKKSFSRSPSSNSL